MRTLKRFFGMTVALAVFGFAGAASAQDDVAATKHNLTATSGNAIRVTTGTDEICVFCHTPHQASTAAKPLWNRDDPNTAGYTMYDSTWSSTIDMVVETTPQGVSLACLSCHDGTVALDAFQNAPGTGPGLVVGGSEGYTFTGAGAGNTFPPFGTGAGQSFANLGQDMTNDHPISVNYNTGLDGAFNLETSFTNVKLANGRVECSSCHNPHNAANPTFLRASNAGSALCLECHQK